MNSNFQTKMKFHIKSTLETLQIEGIRDLQVRWEFLKYRMRKLLIEFSKLQAQNTKKEKMFSENKLKKNQKITQITLKIWNIQTVEINQIKYMNRKLML